MWNRWFGRGESREARFWKWFTENEARYRNFEVNGPEQDALFGVLDHELGRVAKGLQFAFDGGGDGTREFVISADGDRDRIPAVQKLAEAAPALPGWKIVAFRPRLSSPGDLSLHVPDVEISVSNVWFMLQAEGDRIHVALGIPGAEGRDEKDNYVIAFLLLDNLLGEYDVMTRVGQIACYPPPADPEARGLKPLRDLATEFDALYRLTHEAR
jgi:hypothetical protein